MLDLFKVPKYIALSGGKLRNIILAALVLVYLIFQMC